ncbi:NAD(P)/FAD-dependent oxidoreductase [Pseudohoeflea coraliihabitans]|uniref:FAD-binding oxidoreductase n=1 Tax=Pseudohoeflea coraliihabitans TaxID=2860393 RepID=A0ABS6WM29_9HYPH|nr:FAD-binding oxidoreductase [Pseudohoeflea sp. DP4N28-3]MBW3097003.1 FAD-binding oxidoreductase [Pseudohoeflea sp. DP4N28-3]
MPTAVNQLGSAGQLTADLIILGGGVAGCWVALKALDAGLSVTMVERDAIGAGASGGFLGALMPHMPERWDDKKAFQFAALAALSEETDSLSARTGKGTGYARTGRLVPLATPRQREAARARSQAAETSWGWAFSYRIRDAEDHAGWLDPAAAPEGLAFDDLSARLMPSRLLSALAAALAAHPRFSLVRAEGLRIAQSAQATVELADGTHLSASHLVCANGIDAFPLAARVLGLPLGAMGGGVKGQAALLRPTALPASACTLPLLYRDGIYVIAHADGTLAVGSTSETAFAHPDRTDEKLELVLASAAELCPPLRGAEILARWAGVRPRPAGRDPMLGPLPGTERLLMCAGGYKITFGIAHRMADAVLAAIGVADGPDIPSSFLPVAHYEKARSRLGG